MGARGAEFSELQPRNGKGALDIEFVTLPISSQGLESGVIVPVTPFNAFRLGQQIIFWLGVANPVFGANPNDNFMTSVRLKLWWARPNLEYRTPGTRGPAPTSDGSNYLGIDTETFLPGPNTGQDNNRYVWIPSPKRLDVTQYQTPPPVAAEARTSDSLFLDDVWKMDLQDPSDADYIANFPTPQVPSRWEVFMYPAMGYALGFTWDGEFNVDPTPPVAQPTPLVSLSWASGTLGGTLIQESIG